jgi:hypothetical protein
METLLREKRYSPSRRPLTWSKRQQWIWAGIFFGTVIVCAGFGALIGGPETAGLGALIVILPVASFIIYFYPSIIAYRRANRNITGILIVNFVFGWTLLGWVGALVWAVYEDKK